MSKFKAGDLCRIVYCEPDSSGEFLRYKNEIVEVVDFSENAFGYKDAPHLQYGVVALVDGSEWVCSERELQLIDPPDRLMDITTSWENVGWKPKELEKA